MIDIKTLKNISENNNRNIGPLLKEIEKQAIKAANIGLFHTKFRADNYNKTVIDIVMKKLRNSGYQTYISEPPNKIIFIGWEK